MKKIFFGLAGCCFLIHFFILAPGCANIIPPTGGLRDSLPPVLLSVTPPDSVTNFREKKVVFTFDEYVQIDNMQKNLIVSPTLPFNPAVVHRLKTVTVTIRDTLLEPNTTYTLDFGRGLKDNNEGNVYENFKYIFSTGSYLDSLGFEGKVVLAESGGIDSTLMVILHSSADDSAVVKERPRYIARLSPQGTFRFQNLPPGEFYLYAVEDESGAGRYQSKEQLFAFADEPVLVGTDTQPITLYAYAEAPEAASAPGAARGRGDAAQEERLVVQTNLKDGKLSLLDNLQIRFPAAPLKNFDSTHIRILQADSVPVSGYRFALDTSLTKLNIFYSWQENIPYSIIFSPDFAEDTLGRKLLKEDTLRFSTQRSSEYGSIKMRFLNLDMSKNPVLLLVQNNEIKHTHIFTNRDFNMALFPPGEYELRIVYDQNGNGKWDPGNFFGDRRQPERVLPLSRKLTVRANWESEVDIDLERSVPEQ